MHVFFSFPAVRARPTENRKTETGANAFGYKETRRDYVKLHAPLLAKRRVYIYIYSFFGKIISATGQNILHAISSRIFVYFFFPDVKKIVSASDLPTTLTVAIVVIYYFFYPLIVIASRTVFFFLIIAKTGSKKKKKI